ncbi:MAG: hypothetical protein Q9211_002285 [Gyalolechia sp. 1 TL-2023]
MGVAASYAASGSYLAPISLGLSRSIAYLGREKERTSTREELIDVTAQSGVRCYFTSRSALLNASTPLAVSEPVRYYAAADTAPRALPPRAPAPPGNRLLTASIFRISTTSKIPREVQRTEDELEAQRGLPDKERVRLEDTRLGEFEEKVNKLVQTRDAHTAASSRQNIRPLPLFSYTEQVAAIKTLCPSETHTVADVVPEANAKVDDQDLQQGVEKVQEHISTISAHPRRATKCPGQPLSLDASRPRAPEQSMRDATSGE